MKLYSLLSTIVLIQSVQAYFYVPSFMNNLPFKGGMASAQHNNSLYLFGGENATSKYTNDLYQLTQTSTTYNWQRVEQITPPNGTLYSQSFFTADGENMILMGGMSNATAGRGLPMQIYNFNLPSKTWTAHNQNKNESVGNPIPADFVFNKEFFTATYDPKNKLTYVFGGAITALNTVFNTLHVYDAQFVPKALAPTQFGRYGHTTSILR